MSSEKDDASQVSVHVEWSTQVEDILAAEGEKCRGLSWIHTRCETEMQAYNTWIQVPVIILSTLAGTASVGSATLFAGQTTVSSIAIGLVSISVGILNTLGGFFNYAKRAESHRIAHLHFSKISTKIAIELSLPRMERISAESLLNYVRESMERLAETTPLAPTKILEAFNKEFKNLKEDIAMPPETNGLHKIKIYRSNGPVPTPNSFSLDKMEGGFPNSLTHTTLSDYDSKFSELKTSQDKKLEEIIAAQKETERQLAEQMTQRALEFQASKQAQSHAEYQAQRAIALAENVKLNAAKEMEDARVMQTRLMDEMKKSFKNRQKELEKQIKSMETTLLPITLASREIDEIEGGNSGNSSSGDSGDLSGDSNSIGSGNVETGETTAIKTDSSEAVETKGFLPDEESDNEEKETSKLVVE